MSTRRARRARDKRRRHGHEATSDDGSTAAGATTAEPKAPPPGSRPAHRRRPEPASSNRDSRGQRPAPLWGSFPLSEIAIGVGVVVGAVGVLLGQERGAWALLAGIGLCVLAVLEITAREHFSGYRSHAIILALIAVALLQFVLILVTDGAWRGPVAIAVDAVVIAVLAFSLRRRFRRAQVRRIRRRT